ncbi:MAG: hypothetical protein K8T20_13540 [Planctomycetes bacterium]|nr:hypothetical protein [Planctomycetota bacterium]
MGTGMTRPAIALVLLAAGFAQADPRVRWRLDYEGGEPERIEAGGERYLVIACTISNPGTIPAPLGVGHVIRAKGCDDLREGFYPEVLLEAASRAENLGGLSRPARAEELARLQAKRRWLGMSDLTRLRELAPGESAHAAAVLKVKGDWPSTIDVLVEGLEDPAEPSWDPRQEMRYWPLHMRLRTHFESAAGKWTPMRRDLVAPPLDAPVDRKDLAPLVDALEDPNPAIRVAALALLVRYADPAPPSRRSSVSGSEALDMLEAARRFLRAWLSALPEVIRLQAASPAERLRFAVTVRRIHPTGARHECECA